MPSPPSAFAVRYATWIDGKRSLVLAVALLVAGAGAVLAAQLQVRPDLANLLPPSAESVRHLRILQHRARGFGSMFIVVAADDPEKRQLAARRLGEELGKLQSHQLTNVTSDDSVARDYFWKHRFLFIDLADLTAARDALADKIRRAKLDANPLYVDLEDDFGDDDDDDDADAALDDRVGSLKKRLDDAEVKANQAEGFVSKDGKLQLLILRSPFSSSDFGRGGQLLRAIDRAIARVTSELGGGVEFGPTGNIVTSYNEHRSVMRGMLLAAVITIIAVAIALFLYYRAVLPVLASLGSLAVGTLATFAIAKLTLGYLNLVTAFLAAIVVGNGINSGLILLARYFEEVRAGRTDNAGLAAAIAGAARGTLAASVTAGVAYGSLVVTDFRGFRHFGIIGGVGMVLCWISAFTVLPAALCVLRRRGLIRSRHTPAVGRVLARLLPRRLGAVVVVAALVTVGSGVATWRYIASDPLEEDWRTLRPHGPITQTADDWYERIRQNFDKRFRKGITGRFAIGLDDRAAVPALAAQLRAVDEGRSEETRLFGYVRTLDDLLPDQQVAKLALLAEIRALIDDDLADELDPEDKKTAARIRPPDGIVTIGDADVPEDLAWPFIEKDGSRGRLLLAANADRFTTWNVHHRVEFAEGVRALDLPDDAVIGGQSFIFADMIKSMGRDGPLASLVALIGALMVVAVIVGFGRHGLVTITCGVAGILGMIALVSAFGIKVNVIDFIALPITIGIGIDYAVNIAAREQQDGDLGPHALLSTTGGAVLLCSFTTMVGYGSLLLSDSGGIRSFGLAAILGEVACVIAALMLAPALLELLRRRQRARLAPEGGGDVEG